MDNLFITLKLDLTTSASSGAGWYVQAFGDNQTIIPPTPISGEAAHVLSGAFQTALQSTEGELPQVSVQQLVASGEQLVRQALESQLRYAEEQAAKVALLRKKLGHFPPTLPPSVGSTTPVGSPQPRPVPQVVVPSVPK